MLLRHSRSRTRDSMESVAVFSGGGSNRRAAYPSPTSGTQTKATLGRERCPGPPSDARRALPTPGRTRQRNQSAGCAGCGGRTRTSDLGLTSQALALSFLLEVPESLAPRLLAQGTVLFSKSCPFLRRFFACLPQIVPRGREIAGPDTPMYSGGPFLRKLGLLLPLAFLPAFAQQGTRLTLASPLPFDQESVAMTSTPPLGRWSRSESGPHHNSCSPRATFHALARPDRTPGGCGCPAGRVIRSTISSVGLKTSLPNRKRATAASSKRSTRK
jgi:hypothetical protein